MPVNQLVGRTQRRLCAILAVDVAGYSRLMEADEEGTHFRLMQLRAELLEPAVANWRGTIVKHTGDGFLAIFDSVLDAAVCAMDLQRSLVEIGAAQSPETRMMFRMGLNLSDTIVEADDIFGEGVNIAARLQTYAEPGAIVVPAAIEEQLRSHPGIRRVDLGDLHLKNISRPVRAYSLHVVDEVHFGQAHGVPKPDVRPSIAILPFRRNLTTEDDGYFADGIVDDIIRILSSLKDLVVISRGSTLGFGGSRIDVRAIGRDLGVRYVLYGGVARSGGKIRIATELSDALSGAVVWAERYDGEISDIFELQDRISVQVVATLAPQIRERELKRAMRKHPESMDAYDLVLQAIDLLYRMEYRPFSGARGLLQKARLHDADYAPAYAYAAQWHTFRVGQGWSADFQADSVEAARLAAEAIERDRYDANALAICGHARSFLLHDYATGADLLDRALEAGPSCALAWTLGSCTASYTGDGPQAVARAEHSLRLSPRDPLAFFYICNLGIAHYANGAYEEAVLCGRKAFAQKKSFRANLRTLAASLVALDRLEEARSVGAKLLDVDPDFRLSHYEKLCPWQGSDTRDLFMNRLRQANLPN